MASSSVTAVPLYGEAFRDVQPAMEDDAGGKKIALPSRGRWVVSGVIVPEPAPLLAPPPSPAEAKEEAKEEAKKETKKETKPVAAKSVEQAPIARGDGSPSKGDGAKKRQKDTKTDPAIGRKLATKAKPQPPARSAMPRVLLLAVALAVAAFLAYSTMR